MWRAKDGSPIAGRLLARYSYASEKLGVAEGSVMVVFNTEGLGEKGVQEAMRNAADQIAMVLLAGQRPEQAFHYEDGRLSTLDPEERP